VSANSISSFIFFDYQMLEIASPPIMPAHNASDDFLILFGYETEIRVTLKITLSRF
jgi:hypothetical protein